MRLSIYYFLVIISLLLTSSAFAACNPSTTNLVLDAGKGTVADTQTKLMWKVCPEGYTYSLNTCTAGATKTYTWSAALALPADFAGYSGWRLPNIKELQSIVETQCSSPAINPMFTGTPSSAFFWSNSPTAALANYSITECQTAKNCAWAIDFSSGNNLADPLATQHYVRLVRDCTGTECNPQP